MKKRIANARGVILKKQVLRDARKRAGFSQRSLARFIEAHNLTAWRAENGIAVDVDIANSIAAAINVPLAVLIQKSA